MSKLPEKVDLYAGSQVRFHRRRLGMSQETLAEKCGITFQQIQKYENGANRISLSRLDQIAKALGQPPAVFFPPTEVEFDSIADPIIVALRTGAGPLLESWCSMNGEQRVALERVVAAMKVPHYAAA